MVNDDVLNTIPLTNDIENLATGVSDITNEITWERWLKVLRSIRRKKSEGCAGCRFRSDSDSFASEALIYLRLREFPFGYRVAYNHGNKRWDIFWHNSRLGTITPPLEESAAERRRLLQTWASFFRLDVGLCECCMKNFGPWGYANLRQVRCRFRDNYRLFEEAHRAFGSLESWHREMTLNSRFGWLKLVAVIQCIVSALIFMVVGWEWALPAPSWLVACTVTASFAIFFFGAFGCFVFSIREKKHLERANTITKEMEHDRKRALHVFFANDNIGDDLV